MNKLIVELKSRGGAWLGAARSYVQKHCVRGDSVTWGSNDLLHDMSPQKLIAIGARCVEATRLEKKETTTISKIWEMEENPQGAWAEAAKAWIKEHTGRDLTGTEDDRYDFKPALTVAQVEDFSAHVTAAEQASA